LHFPGDSLCAHFLTHVLGAKKIQADSAATPTRKRTARSRVTNGWPFPEGTDGRSSTARRYRDLISELTREHEQGGERALTGTDLALVRQCAGLMVRCEQEQSRIVRGESANEDALIRMSGEVRRILSALRRRTVTREQNGPVGLAAYLATVAPAPAIVPAEDAPRDEGTSLVRAERLRHER
jgi:hypothetical protein